jgi:hypothetical protein
VVGCPWEDPHLGQFQEASCYRDKQMLHVQEDEGVHGPSSFPLRCGFYFVVFSFQPLWVVLVYTTTGYRSACLLVSSGRSRSATVWKMKLTCLFWCLWRERNNESFEDVEKTSEELLSSFYHTLYLWTMAYVLPLSFNSLDFLTCFAS